MTINDAFKAYDFYVLQGKENRKLKTRINYRSACSSFVRSLGDMHVELIGEENIIYWKLDMQQRGNLPNSISYNLMKMRKVLAFCQERKMRVMDYKSIEIPRCARKKNHTWLTPDEIEKTVAAAKNSRDRAIIASLFHTGSRISALLSIDREQYENAHFDEDGIKEIWVEDKNDKPSLLYFNTSVQAIINTYLASRHDPFKPLFISGQRKRITVSRVEQIIHEIEDTIGIKKNLTPHVYRHSFASDLAVNGANLKAMQVLLNHSSMQITGDIYSHFTERQQKQAFKTYHTH